MPNAFTFTHTAPAAKELVLDPIPLPVARDDLDDSSEPYLPPGDGTAVVAAPAAMSNTPPQQITS